MHACHHTHTHTHTHKHNTQHTAAAICLLSVMHSRRIWYPPPPPLFYISFSTRARNLACCLGSLNDFSGVSCYADCLLTACGLVYPCRDMLVCHACGWRDTCSPKTIGSRKLVVVHSPRLLIAPSQSFHGVGASHARSGQSYVHTVHRLVDHLCSPIAC